MTEAIKSTTIWMNSFGDDSYKDHQVARDRLKNSFLRARVRAGQLVSHIAADIPGLTIHDISHLDSLWETASLAINDDEHLNPLEAFILGGAILLHDAGMSLVAYPKGLDELQETNEWKDCVFSCYTDQGNNHPSQSELENPSIEIMREVIPTVLRNLHAKQAAKIATEGWEDPDDPNNKFFIIEDDELRALYGPLIGEIAESHWWNVHELEKLHDKYGAVGDIPASWDISPRKIACLLRIADAIQIDSRRASGFIRALVKPTGISSAHWDFQHQMPKPIIDIKTGEISFSTPHSFSVDQSTAWWLCFDTLQMIDTELKEVDDFLINEGEKRLSVHKVKNIGSPKALATSNFKTEDWLPIDSRFKVSDVTRVASLFGGRNLYGNDITAPIKELLQNGMDSIRARRKLEDRKEDWGELQVVLEKCDDNYWLTVTDNGIGMSEFVMTSVLVDFGHSFWSSNLIKSEFPGLLSKGVKHTGKFGIGFFSIFMLGSYATVTSKRFDRYDGYKTLEFSNGVQSRPLLRVPNQQENNNVRDFSTSISIKIDNDLIDENGLFIIDTNSYRNTKSSVNLNDLVSYLAPSSDINIYTHEYGKEDLSVQANDWLNISYISFLKRLTLPPRSSIEPSIKDRVTLIEDDNTAYGRGYISSPLEGDEPMVTCVGGLRHGAKSGLISGIVTGETEILSRNSASYEIPDKTLAKWATNQATLASLNVQKGFQTYSMARKVNRLGGLTGNLPIVRHSSHEYFDLSEMTSFIVNKGFNQIIFSEGLDTNEDPDISNSNYDDYADFHENVFDIPECDLDEIFDHLNTTHKDYKWTYSESELNITVGDVEGTNIDKDSLIIDIKKSKKQAD
ncbi:MAG: HD domain-containing protein [Neptuniibacter sp.]